MELLRVEYGYSCSSQKYNINVQSGFCGFKAECMKLKEKNVLDRRGIRGENMEKRFLSKHITIIFELQII